MTLASQLPAKQTTLRAPATLSGVGLHTGAEARVRVQPAPADSGILFTGGAGRIPARAAFVVSTQRSTSLGDGTARIDTVEHLLSALCGLGIDNAEIEVEGPEIPILEGSAAPWVEALATAGIVELPAAARWLTLPETVALRDGDSWMVAAPADTFSVTCVTQFDHPLLGTQAATFPANPARYAAEIAPARTFVYAADLEALRAAGLIRGGSLDCALVLYPDRFSDALRFPDECLRHKTLDLWGDLALAGGRLRAAITAIRPGHRINTAFAALLAERVREVNGINE